MEMTYIPALIIVIIGLLLIAWIFFYPLRYNSLVPHE